MKKLTIVLMAISMMFMFVTMALADLNDGLVAYYPFNGNANDESGNGNDGTVYGSALTTDRFGNTDSALFFDGDDKVVIPHSSSITPQQITIAFWFNSSLPLNSSLTSPVDYLHKDSGGAQDYRIQYSSGTGSLPHPPWVPPSAGTLAFILGDSGNYFHYIAYEITFDANEWYLHFPRNSGHTERIGYNIT